MGNFKKAAAMACAFLISLSVHAETTSFDLDTEPGHFANWQVADIAATFVSFSATFAEVKPNRKYAPTYNITLKDSTGQYITFKGFYLGSLEAPIASISSSAETQNNPSNGAIALRIKQTAKIKLSWSNGSLAVDVDGAVRDFKIGFRPTELYISCSTGELKISDLTLVASQPRVGG